MSSIGYHRDSIAGLVALSAIKEGIGNEDDEDPDDIWTKDIHQDQGNWDDETSNHLATAAVNTSSRNIDVDPSNSILKNKDEALEETASTKQVLPKYFRCFFPWCGDDVGDDDEDVESVMNQLVELPEEEHSEVAPLAKKSPKIRPKIATKVKFAEEDQIREILSIPPSFKKFIWWQQNEFSEIKQTIRMISQDRLTPCNKMWMDARSKPKPKKPSSPECDAIMDKLTKEQRDYYDAKIAEYSSKINVKTEDGGKWWHAYDQSRRGFEHVVNCHEGKLRQKAVQVAKHNVLTNQSLKSDESYGREYKKQAAWAGDLALAAGVSDEDAVSSGFRKNRKTRSFFLKGHAVNMIGKEKRELNIGNLEKVFETSGRNFNMHDDGDLFDWDTMTPRSKSSLHASRDKKKRTDRKISTRAKGFGITVEDEADELLMKQAFL